MLDYKKCRVNVPPIRFYLNGHNIGYFPQTHNSESQYDGVGPIIHSGRDRVNGKNGTKIKYKKKPKYLFFAVE